MWNNPQTKIYSIVKFLLETSAENSRTWAIHLRNLSVKYGLGDPLECLTSDPPPKEHFKEHILTKICAHHEQVLRDKARTNHKMRYLDVSLSGLRGRPHPALNNIITTIEVQRSRIHLKMLAGDFYTYEVKSDQSGGSPHCRSCSDDSKPVENLQHILTSCVAYSHIRDRMVGEYQQICNSSKSDLSFQQIYSDKENFCQFILDPASFNLTTRIHVNDPVLLPLFRLSRDYCYAVNAARMKILKNKADMVPQQASS